MRLFFSIIFCFCSIPIWTQHCAPLSKSEIEALDIKTEGGFCNIQFDYLKGGGQKKKTYQIYLFAYLAEAEEEALSTCMAKEEEIMMFQNLPY